MCPSQKENKKCIAFQNACLTLAESLSLRWKLRRACGRDLFKRGCFCWKSALMLIFKRVKHHQQLSQALCWQTAMHAQCNYRTLTTQYWHPDNTVFRQSLYILSSLHCISARQHSLQCVATFSGMSLSARGSSLVSRLFTLSSRADPIPPQAVQAWYQPSHPNWVSAGQRGFCISAVCFWLSELFQM